MVGNTLYYGDNLDILQRYIKDESVDLIYLDPPFNSNASYNVLFEEHAGTKSAAQLQAFKDTWTWEDAALVYEELTLQQGPMANALRSFGSMLKCGGMLAYLTMMAPRLSELSRVLKPTGSIYLHCDSTASHYLKILMDAVFGPPNYRNEVIWKRTSSHNDPNRWGRIHDALLFYSKSADYTWNPVYQPYDEQYLKVKYGHADDSGGRYRLGDLTAPAHGPSGRMEWRGFTPPPGRMWRYSIDNLEKLQAEERIYWTPKGRGGGPGFPQLKQPLDDTKGIPIQDIITDIPPINSQAQERLGYPTQKPEALLERIIRASSKEGDLVLDPFCGCGTAIAVAQRLNRPWIGIDIAQAAIQTIKVRMKDTFGDSLSYKVIGEPTVVEDAKKLANEDPYQFQWWALGLVGARPTEQKKGSDKGIDGRLFFRDDPASPPKQIILSVKAGHTGVAHVHELRGVIEREQAPIGVLITMQEPTGPMKTDAAAAGFYQSPWGKHPRIQILTIKELLEGKKIDYPPSMQVNVTYKKAPKAKDKDAEQLPLA